MFRQAVFVLRWFRQPGCVHCLARDVGISQATGYRYLHEGITVLAEASPDLHEVLQRCAEQGLSHVVLDGTLIDTDRLAGRTGEGNHLWYSGKHKRFGGNVQFLSAPDGTPLWTSDVEPGSVHDLTAARAHVLPALYLAATTGLPTLADKGYIGVHVPVKTPPGRTLEALHPDTRTYNRLQAATRALGERAAAQLKTRWRALNHVTLSPSRIGDIVRATLVLNTTWNETR